MGNMICAQSQKNDGLPTEGDHYRDAYISI